MDHSSGRMLSSIGDLRHDECPDFVFHGEPHEWFSYIKENGQDTRIKLAERTMVELPGMQPLP